MTPLRRGDKATTLAARTGLLGRLFRNEFIRHGSLVFAAGQFVNVLNYVFHFILTRKLGVTGYGEIAALLNALAIISIPAAVLTLIVGKFSAELHAAEDGKRLRALSERILLYSGMTAAMLFVAGALVSPLAASYLRLADVRVVLVLFFVFALSLVMPGARGVLQGVQDFRRFAISTGLETGLKVALGVIFVFAGYGVLGAMCGYALGTLTALGYTVFAVRAHWELERVPLFIDVRRLVRATGGIAVGTVVSVVLGSMDVPLVKHFFDPQQAGLYSGAIALTGKVLFFIVGFVPTLVLPKATAAAVRGDNPLPVIVQGAVMLLSLSLTGLLIYFLFPATVVRLLAGASYVSAAPYVFAYGLAVSFLAATNLTVTYKIGLHRFDFVTPLLLVMIGEIVAINLWHPSIHAVIEVLLVGNCAAFLSTLYRLNAPVIAYSLPHAEPELA